jgi:hypothetical protein
MLLKCHPVPATAETQMFQMGNFNHFTGGRCGACTLMGCIPVPNPINVEIMKVQEYQVTMTGGKSFMARMKAHWNRITKTIYNKLLPNFYNR